METVKLTLAQYKHLAYYAWVSDKKAFRRTRPGQPSITRELLDMGLMETYEVPNTARRIALGDSPAPLIKVRISTAGIEALKMVDFA